MIARVKQVIYDTAEVYPNINIKLKELGYLDRDIQLVRFHPKLGLLLICTNF